MPYYECHTFFMHKCSPNVLLALIIAAGIAVLTCRIQTLCDLREPGSRGGESSEPLPANTESFTIAVSL